MENDRVFELLKEGNFKAIDRDDSKIIYDVYCAYWASGDLYVKCETDNYSGISVKQIQERVPWVDKYKDVIIKHGKTFAGLNTAPIGITETIMNAVKEIETIHNKGESDE